MSAQHGEVETFDVNLASRRDLSDSPALEESIKQKQKTIRLLHKRLVEYAPTHRSGLFRCLNP